MAVVLVWRYVMGTCANCGREDPTTETLAFYTAAGGVKKPLKPKGAGRNGDLALRTLAGIVKQLLKVAVRSLGIQAASRARGPQGGCVHRAGAGSMFPAATC